MRNTVDDPILGAILRLAGPACLTFLLQNAYHLNDAWFLGRHSPVSVNAMGLFMMVSIANFGFILALARGTQSLMARNLGAGNREASARALAHGLALAAKVAVPLAVIEWIFAPDLVRLMGGRGEVAAAGVAYLRTLILFMPMLFAATMVDFAFQGLGNAVTPFRLGCVAVVINLVLNGLLVLDSIEVFGVVISGAGMGVVGAALATGVSRTVAPALGLLLLVRRYRFEPLLALSNYRHDARLAKEIVRVGVPAGSSTLLFGLVAMTLNQLIGRFGQDAYGAFGIGFRGIESVSFMLVLGIGVATGTVCAHSVGAGRFERARRAGHVGVGLGAAAMSVTTILMLTIPERLAGFYTDDPGIIAVTVTYVTTMAFCQIPQALEMIYAEAMAGAGSSLRTAIITIPGNVLRLPLAWLFAVGLGWGLVGVWYAVLTSACLKGLGVAALFFSRKWEKAMLVGRQALDVR